MVLAGFIVGTVIGVAAVAGLSVVLLWFHRRRTGPSGVAASQRHGVRQRRKRSKNVEALSLAPSPTFFGSNEDSVHDEVDEANANSSIEYSCDDGAAGSFSTVDYDYAKTRDGGSSIVSSVGGTLGELTQKSDASLNLSLSNHHESLAEDHEAQESYKNQHHFTTKKFQVKLNKDTKHLGMIIHSAEDLNSISGSMIIAKGSNKTEYPMVHSLKETSPLIDLGVSAGDLLIRVNDKSMSGQSAMQVSKIIRNSLQKHEDGCSLTFMRHSKAKEDD